MRIVRALAALSSCPMLALCVATSARAQESDGGPPPASAAEPEVALPDATAPDGGSTDDADSADPAAAEHTPPDGDHAAEAPPAGEPTLTPEEEAALNAALGADAAALGDAPVDVTPDALDTAMQQANTALSAMNPAISVIFDGAAAWFSDDNLQTGAHDPASTGFHLQQLEVAAGASVDPFFRFDTNLVLSQFGVEIEEAYATTLSLPFQLQVRAGQFLTRFGRQNPTHPHTWHFVDQPLVLGKMMGSDGNRGLGVELSWLAPLPWFTELVFSSTEAGNECCARSFLGSSLLEVRSPADVIFTGALKQFFPFGDEWSLLWGLSAQTGPNPSGPLNRSELFGTDLYLRWRPLADPGRGSVSLQAEGIHRRRQVPTGVIVDQGAYAQLVAQFWLQWELAARAEAVTGALHDPLDPDWSGLRTRYSAQASFYPSHFSRLRLQAAYGAPGEGATVVEQLYEHPVFSVMVALEVLIGAHASHAF